MLYNNGNFKDYSHIWLPLEKEWREKNGYHNKKRGFVDSNFLTWIVVNKKNDSFESEDEKKKYEEALYYIFDEMVRRLLISKKWARFDSYYKDEMYQEAMLRLLGITNTYREGASAFTYATTIITSSFKDILTREGKWSILKQKLRSMNESNSAYLYGEVDSNIQSNIDSNLSQDRRINKKIDSEGESEKNSKSYYDLEYTVPYLTIDDHISFYDDILEYLNMEYVYREIKLLTHPNLPTFKRIYKGFNRCLVPRHLRLPSKKILDLKHLDEETKRQIIILELVDLSKINENEGQHKNLLKDRVIRARNNGFQYFGIFSDDWWVNEEIENQEEVRNHFIGLLKKMIGDIENSSSIIDPIKYYPNLDYIEPKVFQEHYKQRYKVDTFWGLDSKRDQRKFLSDINDYMKWVDYDHNNTRVWSYGILDMREEG